MIRACPVCGNPVQNTCWHPPDDDMQAVDMTVDRAIELAETALSEAVGAAEHRRDILDRLRDRRES